LAELGSGCEPQNCARILSLAGLKMVASAHIIVLDCRNAKSVALGESVAAGVGGRE
jgi:hypothetical protein